MFSPVRTGYAVGSEFVRNAFNMPPGVSVEDFNPEHLVSYGTCFQFLPILICMMADGLTPYASAMTLIGLLSRLIR